MLSFHYIVCNIADREKYHVKKLVFVDQKLEKTDEYFMSEDKISMLKNSNDEKNYTMIDDSKIDLDTFLKSVNLFYN